MKIAKNTVVSVNYKLSDAQNNLIEEGAQPMVYLHGGYENTLPKIEEHLDGKEVGFNSTLQIEPEDAFGDYDAELVKVEERTRLPEPIEVGMQFEGMADGAPDDEPVIFTAGRHGPALRAVGRRRARRHRRGNRPRPRARRPRSSPR